MLLFEEIYSYNSPGVYALINAQDKKIYVGYSANMLRSVSELVGRCSKNIAVCPLELAGLSEDIGKLRLEILETSTDYNTKKLRIRMAFWVNKYLGDGWELYRKYRGLRYKIRTYIGRDMSVYVEAKSQSNVCTILGVFETVRRADRFIETFYPDGVEEFIFANNYLTAEHYGVFREAASETRDRRVLSQLVELRKKQKKLLRSKE